MRVLILKRMVLPPQRSPIHFRPLPTLQAFRFLLRLQKGILMIFFCAFFALLFWVGGFGGNFRRLLTLEKSCDHVLEFAMKRSLLCGYRDRKTMTVRDNLEQVSVRVCVCIF